MSNQVAQPKARDTAPAKSRIEPAAWPRPVTLVLDLIADCERTNRADTATNAAVAVR